MSRRKATPPPAPDKSSQADPPAAVQAEGITLRTLRDSEQCANLPGRTKELLLHGDGPDGRYVLDDATGGAQADELWDRLNQANEVNYALWRRLNQAHCAVCLAESNGDLLLRDVQRLVQEQWGWGIAGLRHASTWLQSEYGLTAEQADALPLPELRARLRAKSAGASEGDTGRHSAGEPREVLSDNEYTVLRGLLEKHPRLVLLEDLAADTRIGRKVCGQIVRSLIARGLAERPYEYEGPPRKGPPRKGATITPRGEELLRAADAAR